ncbi:MAG: stage V sporulation protein AA [Cellulosilyticaceae bacterium]
MGQEVYIKPDKRVSVIAQPIIRLKDVAEVSAEKIILKEIENLCVFEVKNTSQKKSYVISIIDMIQVITTRFPDVTVSNVGEMDTIIHFLPEPIKVKPWMEFIKVAAICIIIFAGVSVAIMAYHIDTSMGRTFMILNEVFTGKYEKNPLYITIPYAIGIPFGTLIFFNHIGTKKITEDPTPIEVEVNGYETQVEDTMIDTLTRQKKKGGAQ